MIISHSFLPMRQQAEAHCETCRNRENLFYGSSNFMRLLNHLDWIVGDVAFWRIFFISFMCYWASGQYEWGDFSCYLLLLFGAVWIVIIVEWMECNKSSHIDALVKVEMNWNFSAEWGMDRREFFELKVS